MGSKIPRGEKMNVNQMFPSRFLRGAELQGPVTVTIQRIGQEEVYKPGKGKESCWILYAERASRGVVLSKSLAESIAQALGESDTDQWPGRQVTLYPQPMSVAGRDLVAIRAREATNGK
jgi:hypothetical protein